MEKPPVTVNYDDSERHKLRQELLIVAAHYRTSSRFYFFFGVLVSVLTMLMFFVSDFGTTLRKRNRVVTGTILISDLYTRPIARLGPGDIFSIHDSTQFIYVISTPAHVGVADRQEVRATSKKDHVWNHSVAAMTFLVVAAFIIGWTKKIRSDSYYRSADRLKDFLQA